MKHYCIKQHDITDCGAACLANSALGVMLQMGVITL